MVTHGMRVAAIDVGSNSIHMVVAEVEADGRFRVLDRAKEMVRLGRRTLSKGRLSTQAIDAGVRTWTLAAGDSAYFDSSLPHRHRTQWRRLCLRRRR